MTPELKAWIKNNTALIILSCFAVFTVLMQLLHICKVNVLKVIVLMGTFSLAVAFAGNDLVNFIGVPLSGLASVSYTHLDVYKRQPPEWQAAPADSTDQY